LVVGDRLDTDIGGAMAMGWDSLLVLTGASTPAGLLETPYLPTFVARDLSGLLDDLPPARFRPAGLEHAAAIRTLLEESELLAGGVEERIEDTIVSSGIVGSGEIHATACLQREEGFGILRSVAVRKPLQGKNLGLLAVAAAMTRARAQGIRHVSLFTETAVGFFERLGFRRVDRADLPEPVRNSTHAAEECAITAAAMVRDL
jgi:N-acetylglutamate synthase-like GNAT family acetyltransferase